LNRKNCDIEVDNVSKHQLSHIDIEITKKCNLACIHCSATSNRIGRELSSREVKAVLSKASSLGLKNIGFTGGEPLVRKAKLMELLRYCRRTLDTRTHLHTNGTKLGTKDAKLLSDLVDEVTVTILGSKSRTHDSITSVKGSLKETEHGLRNLVRQHANVRIFLVPMKRNYREIPQIVKKVHEIGCDKFRILSLAPTGRARDNFEALSLDAKDIAWLTSKLVRTRKDMGVEIEIGFCTQQDYPRLGKLRGHESCFAAEDRVHIDAFGEVFPCTASSGWQPFSAGNIRRYALDLSDIWASSPLFQLFRYFHSNPPGKCRSCTTYSRCMGGCRVIMHYKYGDITAVKANCGL